MIKLQKLTLKKWSSINHQTKSRIIFLRKLNELQENTERQQGKIRKKCMGGMTGLTRKEQLHMPINIQNPRSEKYKN